MLFNAGLFLVFCTFGMVKLFNKQSALTARYITIFFRKLQRVQTFKIPKDRIKAQF